MHYHLFKLIHQGMIAGRKVVELIFQFKWTIFLIGKMKKPRNLSTETVNGMKRFHDPLVRIESVKLVGMVEFFLEKPAQAGKGLQF